MKKRLFGALKKHDYDVYSVAVIRDGYNVDEIFNITKKALKARLNSFIKDFENGLINVDQVDDYSGIANLSFKIDDLIKGDNYILYIEGVVVEVK